MISILQLQYFLAMAEEGHLTRTAEKLYVSQSTLSTMISKLEHELGVALFDRKNNRIILNEYGREYRKSVIAALDAIEDGARRVRKLSADRANCLAIALPNAQLWSNRLLEFRNKHPEIHIQILSDRMEEYSQLLSEKKIDFIIAGEEDIDTRQAESVLLAENRLCLSVPPGHPLAARESVSLKEVELEPYIELSPGLPYRSFCDRLYRKLGVQMNTVIECSYDMRPRLVLGGYGVAVTTTGPLTRALFAGAQFVPISDEAAVRPIKLFWLRGREFTSAMETFRVYITTPRIAPPAVE